MTPTNKNDDSHKQVSEAAIRAAEAIALAFNGPENTSASDSDMLERTIHRAIDIATRDLQAQLKEALREKETYLLECRRLVRKDADGAAEVTRLRVALYRQGCEADTARVQVSEWLSLAPDLAQLLQGWHSDGTAWSAWDQSVYEHLLEIQSRHENNITISSLAVVSKERLAELLRAGDNLCTDDSTGSGDAWREARKGISP